MALVLGNTCTANYNSGTAASPTWVPIPMVGDVTVNLECGEAEIDLRISNWILNLPAKLSGTVDLALANDIGGTVFDVLRTQFFARTQKQFAFGDAAIATSGTEFFKAFAFFSSFPWNQATQEVSNHDASLSLGYTEESAALVEPAWATT